MHRTVCASRKLRALKGRVVRRLLIEVREGQRTSAFGEGGAVDDCGRQKICTQHQRVPERELIGRSQARGSHGNLGVRAPYQAPVDRLIGPAPCERTCDGDGVEPRTWGATPASRCPHRKNTQKSTGSISRLRAARVF